MKSLILRISGLAAALTLGVSCVDYDMCGYYRFNDAEITEPVFGLDIDWRDANVNICYWDKPYTRIYDNGDAHCLSYYKMNGHVLDIRYSDNNHRSYNKSLTVYFPKGTVLDFCDIDVISANVYADVDSKDVDIDSVSGNVSYSTWYQPHSVDIDTTSGNVAIAFPEGFGFHCDFDSVAGGYSSEFRVAISDGCLVYGDRYTQIEVDTVSGNLDLLINR